MTDQLITPVILCGGAGTRLWPVSREKMPKHFVPLIGSLTTFQQVLDRVTRNGLFAAPIIITNSDFRFVVDSIHSHVNRPAGNPPIRLEIRHAIDEKKRIPVRQDALDGRIVQRKL